LWAFSPATRHAVRVVAPIAPVPVIDIQGYQDNLAPPDAPYEAGAGNTTFTPWESLVSWTPHK